MTERFPMLPPAADESHNIVEFPLPDRPITTQIDDKLHSEAFRGLERDLCDCVQMSKIAANLMCDVDDGSNASELFAVVHVHDMLVSLRQRYYALWHGEVRPNEAPAPEAAS